MMKYSTLQKWSAQLSCLLLIGTAVLFLGGCAKEPDSAAVESAEMPSDAIPAVDDSASAGEAIEPTQPAAEIETPIVEGDVSVFLEDALKGHLESVRQAIEAGVDVNSADEEQRTALLFASFNGHTSVVKLLLDSGALLSQRDGVGRTALMWAATGDNAEAVDLLLESGAEVNAADTSEGFTALMHAAAEGHVEVVKVLLKHNADPALRDTDGDTARDIATRNRHVDVVQVLAN
jgi:hypothetical protein